VKHLKNDHFNQQPHSSTVEQVQTTNNVSLDSIENAQLFVQTEPSQPQYLQQSTNIQSKNKPLPVIATVNYWSQGLSAPIISLKSDTIYKFDYVKTRWCVNLHQIFALKIKYLILIR
jgi:hypothetical protein